MHHKPPLLTHLAAPPSQNLVRSPGVRCQEISGAEARGAADVVRECYSCNSLLGSFYLPPSLLLFPQYSFSELHPLRAPHEVLVWQKRMLLLIILLPSLLRLALTEKELLHAAHHFLGVFLGF